MNLCDQYDIRRLLRRHGFRFSHSMGQNFLIDAGTLDEIVSAAGLTPGCGVLEIGPGIGTLTRELSQRAGRVTAIELDENLLPILAETLADRGNVEIIHGDALKLNLRTLAAESFLRHGLTPVICANLPYHITSPILREIIKADCFAALTLLVQKETAEKLSAPEGSGKGSWLGLYLQCYMDVDLLFDVPSACFLPPPKVTSSLLRCVRRGKPVIDCAAMGFEPKFFLRVIRGGFSLRRKTLVNSLHSAFPILDKQSIETQVTAIGLPRLIRGERLTLEQYAALAVRLRSALDDVQKPSS